MSRVSVNRVFDRIATERAQIEAAQREHEALIWELEIRWSIWADIGFVEDQVQKRRKRDIAPHLVREPTLALWRRKMWNR